MKTILKELTLALLLAGLVIGGFRAGLNAYLERRELQHQVAMLEREADELRGMVEDSRILAGRMKRRVAVVDTDYSAREMIWLMRDHFREAGIMVEVH